ncbi:MAG: hypothetical protein KIG43_06885 [Eubacteriales bacterium]|nr:hypothetical protein [Eubacteriales bacterium]MCI7571009.1 hypothetical protein [Clostridiales bacterium]MDD7550071.1 hypothetical protein [Clostridia bacterium]MDY5755047.1 hypothetical protein [Eubacteriales bacterium]
MEAKGSGFLKVTGILMIIGGAISLIVAIVAIIGIAALVYVAGSEINAGLLYAAGVISLVSAVAELIAGIVGVKNCKKPEKARTCVVWGVIVAVLCVAGSVLTVVGGNSFPVFSLILGLVLPVLYIVGAIKNKA